MFLASAWSVSVISYKNLSCSCSLLHVKAPHCSARGLLTSRLWQTGAEAGPTMVCWASTSHFIGLIRQEKQQQSSCWCRLLLKVPSTR